MTQYEFENLIGKGVCDADYEVIEKVYTWHPAIKNSGGKEQMKILYTQFGIGVIKAMVPVAEKMQALDNEKNKLKAMMRLIEEREQLIAEGDMSLEDAIVTVEQLYSQAETQDAFEELMKTIKIDNGIKNTARKIVGC